jgi:hypothetical protein
MMPSITTRDSSLMVLAATSGKTRRAGLSWRHTAEEVVSLFLWGAFKCSSQSW